MLKIILSSKSPRRRQILKEFGYSFSVVTVETSEIFDENLSLDQALSAVSRAKVEAYLGQVDKGLDTETLVIGADTIVALDEHILGKPDCEKQAFDYLARLSGKTHFVKTGVSLYNCHQDLWHEFVETSTVKMKVIKNDQINKYIKSGEPMDKAGAYAIQGDGGQLVESYSGSWYNIVGFPIERFQVEIKNMGWDI